MTIIEAAEKILKKTQKALQPTQMWQYIKEYGLEEELGLKGKTPWQSFSASIYMETKKQNSKFEIAQERPLLIKLKGQKAEIEVEKISKENKNFCEMDLHPLLVNFVGNDPDWQVKCKTIIHNQSQRQQKGFNKWVHPDIVGICFEYSKFKDNKEVFDLINRFDKLPLKFYSFEIKKELTTRDLREYFFQAVSNSSWANEGYLVALNVDESKTELMDLIYKLNSAFGIGIISLNGEDVAQSKVIVPAKFRENIDFGFIQDLSKINENFKTFIKNVVEFDPNSSYRFDKDFDEILNPKDMADHLKKHNIK